MQLKAAVHFDEPSDREAYSFGTRQKLTEVFCTTTDKSNFGYVYWQQCSPSSYLYAWISLLHDFLN